MLSKPAKLKYRSVQAALVEYYLYLDLVASIIWHSPVIKITGMRETLSSTRTFLSQPNTISSRVKSRILLSALIKAVDLLSSRIVNKKSIKSIAEDYYLLIKSAKPPQSYGIEYGWLEQRIEFPKELISFPGDMPDYAIIGIGLHAFTAQTEEKFLLEDAVFNLAKAEELLRKLDVFGDKLKTRNGDPEDLSLMMDEVNLIKVNICSYARMALINSFAFLESFVNGVGLNYRNKRTASLTPQEVELLSGYKKGKYISLEHKIESTSKIINGSPRPPIVLSDEKQAKEPFVSLLWKYKQLRDASMHYSKDKEAIWRKPHEWVAEAKTVVELTLAAGRQFWIACYPSSSAPEYIYRLDYERLYAFAKRRNDSEVDFENRIAKFL